MTDIYDGEWHDWNGRTCPVPPETRVEVLSWAGCKRIYRASGMNWSDNTAQNHVVKFRVLKEQHKITMDGKWAYRHDPFTEVEVLKVGLDNPIYPVLSLDPVWSRPLVHEACGRVNRNLVGNGYDLIPLQVKREPEDLFRVASSLNGSGPLYTAKSGEAEVLFNILEGRGDDVVLTHFREVIEGEE